MHDAITGFTAMWLIIKGETSLYKKKNCNSESYAI